MHLYVGPSVATTGGNGVLHVKGVRGDARLAKLGDAGRALIGASLAVRSAAK